jgi:NAD(P)H dehydrogenase (quinone)
VTVAVIGATGTVGPCVVSSLQARGADVRVLTRDADRAKSILGPGIEIRPVDIGEHDQVLAACTGVASVLLLTSHAHDMTDLQLRIIRALRRLDVKIVKISGTSSAINPDGPYTLRQHWEVETVLRASGQPYVNLRPNANHRPAVRPAGRDQGDHPGGRAHHDDRARHTAVGSRALRGDVRDVPAR